MYLLIFAKRNARKMNQKTVKMITYKGCGKTGWNE